MRADAHFWSVVERLVTTSEIVIDRPKGSTHPRYPNLVYPLDYGYLESTRSGDGAGIDVWVGSLPEKEVTGVVVSVDVQKRDAEIKVLVACTPGEARVVLAFHNDGDQAAMLLEHGEERV
jgi:inorganic pyrophosphatase